MKKITILLAVLLCTTIALAIEYQPVSSDLFDKINSSARGYDISNVPAVSSIVDDNTFQAYVANPTTDLGDLDGLSDDEIEVFKQNSLKVMIKLDAEAKIEYLEQGEFNTTPDATIYSTEAIARSVMNANESQMKMVEDAINNGEIELDPTGFTNNIVFFFGKLFMKIASWFS